MTNSTEHRTVRRHVNDAPPPASQRAPAQWSVRNASLTAGIALLLMSVVAIFGNVVVVDGLTTQGDAAATAADITASAGMFRLGIVSLIVVIALDVVIAWALYRVFSPVNASLSMLAAIMRLVYSAVFMVAIGELLGVIRLLSDEGNRAVLGTEQVQIQTMQGMTSFNDIWYVGQFLFGLNLLLLGYLAYRSGYVPRLLGALLVISGLGYAIDSFGAVLSEGPWTDITTFTFLGEFLLALWLVIRARGVAAGAAELEADATPEARHGCGQHLSEDRWIQDEVGPAFSRGELRPPHFHSGRLNQADRRRAVLCDDLVEPRDLDPAPVRESWSSQGPMHMCQLRRTRKKRAMS